MKSLVVYFSHEGENSVDFNVKQVKKGHTRTVAEKIALRLGADIFRIVPAIPYPADYEECIKRAQKEYEDNIHPQIILPLPQASDYDRIYLGFPIWFRTYPRTVATFIDIFDFAGKTVFPFCTNEEGAFGVADFELENAIKQKGGKTSRGLAVRGTAVENCEDAVEKWLSV